MGLSHLARIELITDYEEEAEATTSVMLEIAV